MPSRSSRPGACRWRRRSPASPSTWFPSLTLSCVLIRPPRLVLIRTEPLPVLRLLPIDTQRRRRRCRRWNRLRDGLRSLRTGHLVRGLLLLLVNPIPLIQEFLVLFGNRTELIQCVILLGVLLDCRLYFTWKIDIPRCPHNQRASRRQAACDPCN